MALTVLDSTGIYGGFGLNSGHLTSNERPTSFRTAVARRLLNGKAPLTALTAASNNEKVDDPKFTWWEEEMPLQNGAATFYQDAALSSAHGAATTVAVGGTVYAKVSADTVKHFRAGYVVQLIDLDGNPNKTIVGRIKNVLEDGASSRLDIVMLQAPDAAGDLEDMDFVQSAGNAYNQGATRPDIVGYGRKEISNYTQIFRTPFKITRTAKKTRYRTGDRLKDLRTKHLELHQVAQEEAWLFGEQEWNTDEDEPRSMTRGIVNHVLDATNGAPQNFAHFKTDYPTGTWDDKHNDFIEENLTQLFMYSDGGTKIGYCGPKFAELMNRAARLSGHTNITVGQTDFGMKVTEWHSPFGTVMWKTHPLFARNTQRQHMCVFVEPGLLRRRILDDTKLNTLSSDEIKKLGPGFDGFDGTVQEYITEVGLELHHAKAFGVWHIEANPQ